MAYPATSSQPSDVTDVRPTTVGFFGGCESLQQYRSYVRFPASSYGREQKKEEIFWSPFSPSASVCRTLGTVAEDWRPGRLITHAACREPHPANNGPHEVGGDVLARALQPKSTCLF